MKNKPKVLTVDKIYNEYGFKPNTLKYMRENPKKNDGDVPTWFPIMNRPHYPTDQFDLWYERQKNKGVKSAKSDNKLKLVKKS